MFQEIIYTGLVQSGASKVEAKVILGGDQPWTRRVIRVSTCPKVGSKPHHFRVLRLEKCISPNWLLGAFMGESLHCARTARYF